MQMEWQTVSALFAQAYLSENLGSLRYYTGKEKLFWF